MPSLFDPQARRAILGRLAALARPSMLGDRPMSRNGPTVPEFKITDPRQFATEKERLRAAIEAFALRGPEHAAGRPHPFFGRLTGDEWGHLMHKHLDHHLRQFSV